MPVTPLWVERLDRVLGFFKVLVSISVSIFCIAGLFYGLEFIDKIETDLNQDLKQARVTVGSVTTVVDSLQDMESDLREIDIRDLPDLLDLFGEVLTKNVLGILTTLLEQLLNHMEPEKGWDQVAVDLNNAESNLNDLQDNLKNRMQRIRIVFIVIMTLLFLSQIPSIYIGVRISNP